ncbi:hypothetical protein D6C87_07403 [Aureobasidium pullulans]|uniref:HNH nuclease domain-containing protein n=1 Tax=Aureobasidium pullulans TaxID=5580 RepID=A0AB38LP48_AURPU|nr:hypothetical protein D6C94_08979 [Aureobasidium pullulans]THZ39056.1 hypothetical protein D6C87_07403 [Aureobasidium pullulans]
MLDWPGDEGADSEPWPACGDLRLRHFRPTPAGAFYVFSQKSTTITDGAVACFLKLTPSTLRTLYCDVYEALRAPVAFVATEDISVRSQHRNEETNTLEWTQEVVCNAGETVLGWHLASGDDTDIFLAKAKALFIFDHPDLFGLPSNKTIISNEWDTDADGRWDIVPYHYRLLVLDRVFNSCATKMKQFPLLRSSDTELDRTMNTQWGPKGRLNLHKGPAPSTPKSPKKRNTKAVKLKTRALEIEDTTHAQNKKHKIQFPDLCFDDTGSGLTRQQDIDPNNLLLGMVWEFLRGKGLQKRHHYLEWTHDDVVYYVTNDSRFRKMVKTVSDSCKAAMDPLTKRFVLMYKAGRIPDGADDPLEWEAL